MTKAKKQGSDQPRDVQAPGHAHEPERAHRPMNPDLPTGSQTLEERVTSLQDAVIAQKRWNKSARDLMMRLHRQAREIASMAWLNPTDDFLPPAEQDLRRRIQTEANQMAEAVEAMME